MERNAGVEQQLLNLREELGLGRILKEGRSAERHHGSASTNSKITDETIITSCVFNGSYY